MHGSSIFSSGVIMIINFHFTFFIYLFTNLTFTKIFKIFMIFFSHKMRFIKFCFNSFRTIFTFIYHIIKNLFNSIFINVIFAWFTTSFIKKYYFLAITVNNLILISFSVLTKIDIITWRYLNAFKITIDYKWCFC